MRKNMFLNKKIVLAAVVFLAVVVLARIGYGFINKSLADSRRDHYEYLAENKAREMTQFVERIFVHSHILREMIIQNNGDIEFFDQLAPVIYRTIELDKNIKLRNMAIAPNGIVEKVYPLIDNAEFLKFNLFDKNKKGNVKNLDIYRQGTTIVTNPFTLVQGGVGIAGRTPILLNDNGVEKLWGLITVTINFAEILEHFELDKLAEAGINYDFWYNDENNKHVSIKASSEVTEDAVTVPIKMYNLDWYLSISPTDGWYSPHIVHLEIISTVVIAILFSLLTSFYLRQREINEKLSSLVDYDGLTKCYSRNYLHENIIDVVTGKWREKEKKYSIAILDIDNFKQINDNEGHEIGDQVLASVAKIIKKHTDPEKGEKAVRFGGDEFVIFWVDISPDEIVSKLESIQLSVRELRFKDHKKLRITLSIGAQAYSSAPGAEYLDMLRAADEKLYWAKERGKNQFVI